ncbi:MAG: hypothetical protein J6D47_03630 [Peptostreptococcaceae bacterium]|nr:hypothetical protein [Peptostreptococcaceae bacterium]
MSRFKCLKGKTFDVMKISYELFRLGCYDFYKIVTPELYSENDKIKFQCDEKGTKFILLTVKVISDDEVYIKDVENYKK